MDTTKTQYEHLQRLKSTLAEIDRQKTEIKDAIDFFDADDPESHQVIISFLHECVDKISAAHANLDSAIQCLTQ